MLPVYFFVLLLITSAITGGLEHREARPTRKTIPVDSPGYAYSHHQFIPPKTLLSEFALLNAPSLETNMTQLSVIN